MNCVISEMPNDVRTLQRASGPKRQGYFLPWCHYLGYMASALFLSLGRASFADIDPSVNALVEKVIAAQAENRRWLASAAGEGVLEYANAAGTAHSTWNISFRQHEKQLYLECALRPDDAVLRWDQNFNVIRIVADGETTITGLFSPRIRPVGASGECWIDNVGEGRSAMHDIGLDPREYLIPPLLRSEKYLQGFGLDGNGVANDPEAEPDSLVIQGKDEVFWRLKVSPQLEYRIAKCDFCSNKTPLKPLFSMEYYWIREDGVIRPAEIMFRRLDPISNEYEFHHLILKSLSSDVQNSDPEFAFEKLQLPAGAVVVDRRPKAVIRVRKLLSNEPPSDENNRSLSRTLESLPSAN